jgi:hypothetical protein
VPAPVTHKPEISEPEVSEPKVPPAKTSSLKLSRVDVFNIFFVIFGAAAVIVGLLSHVLLIAVILGITFIGTSITTALIEKSINWPAWRIIIAITLVAGVLFVYFASPKTESVRIDMFQFSGWNIVNPPLEDFPVSDNPQTGHQYSNYELDMGGEYAVNARCWTSGQLTGYPKIEIRWVSIKGGDYDGLWIPSEAIGMNSPGLANDLPNCNSLWFKVFPFL